ncbi:MAG: hypothetical protein ACFWT7_07670 [Succiniclasticum sp.]
MDDEKKVTETTEDNEKTTETVENTEGQENAAPAELREKWYRRICTKRRLKQAGTAVVVLAVLGVAGEGYMHYRHGIAKAQAMETRSKVLTNLAAKENIQILTADQARQKVAEALGTDAGSLQVQSVLLQSPLDRKEDRDDHDRKEERHRDKKEKHDFREEREERHEKGFFRGDRDGEKGPEGQPRDWKGRGFDNGTVPPRMRQGVPNDRMTAPIPGAPNALAQGLQPAAPAQGQTPTTPAQGLQPAAPAQGQQPAAPVQGQQPAAPAQDNKGLRPGMPGALDVAHGPLFYKVQATYNGSRTDFLVDARSGKILHMNVRPEKNFLEKLF